MTHSSTACKNCGATLTGNFCQQCGQQAIIHPITLKHLLHEFFHALTHADKGVLFLMKEMTYRPGFVAAEYLEGKRKKYFNPLSFLVLASAVWALAVVKAGYFESMGSGYDKSGAYMPPQFAFYFSESMKIIVAYGKVISLIVTVPLLSFLTWLVFWKRKYAYAENLVLHAFLVGQLHLVLVLIFIPLFLITGHADLNNNVYQFVFLTYLAVAYHQFFKGNVWLNILKAIVVQALFIVFFWVLIFGFVFLREQLLH